MARTILLTALAGMALVAAPQASPEPVRLPLKDASERREHDFSPVHEGRFVEVTGLVAAPPTKILDYSLVGIQDATGYGLFVSAPPATLQHLAPGNQIRVTGTLSKRGGVAAVIPGSIEVVERGSPVIPVRVRPGALRSFTYLGTLVETEGIVVTRGENSGGEILQVGQEPDSIRIFLPRLHARADSPLGRFDIGDRVRVTGISSQYCPLPPHDRFFQVMISDPGTVVLLEPRNLLPPELVSAAVALAVAVLAIWWIRERRLSGQHRQMRILNGLSEDILAASSVPEILRKLRTELPAAFDISGVELYLCHHGSSSLESVQPQGEPPGPQIPVSAPADSPDSPVAACFRNRAILKVPDTRRSPFYPEPASGSPRSVVLFPMIAQGDVLGVLELFSGDRRLSLGLDEQAGAQHVANQVAAALRLLEQQTVREQLFRSERLAASGQLITGVAGQLREPLATIATSVSGLLEQCDQPEHQRDLLTIASEARHAAGIVARLVSFTRADKAQARPVDLEALLEGLVEFRNRECRTRGISVSADFSGDPLVVLGSEGQLEHVFLSLLVHAGQQVAGERERSMSVSARRLGGQALVEISYTQSKAGQAPEESNGADGFSLGLDLCRGVIQAHGGAIRMTNPTPGLARVEVELPLYEAKVPAEGTVASASRSPGRLLTTLVIDGDVATRRDLVAVLASRGHRAVPVGSAEEAVDLIDRLRFDVVFCAARLPGLNWVEFFERSRRRIGTFVLLTEGYDAELARAFPGGEGLLLSKPVEESALNAVLAGTESTAPLRRH